MDTIIHTGKALGTLLYYPPLSPELNEMLELLQDEQIIRAWPLGTAEELETISALIKNGLADINAAEDAYRRLFVGPAHLASPPWGSVYLDKEAVLFGESTLKLREWQRGVGIKNMLSTNEPEDHIGLMLMLASWIAENKADLLTEYLAEHLFTWSDRFLELLTANAENPFYEGLAKLTTLTIEGWKKA